MKPAGSCRLRWLLLAVIALSLSVLQNRMRTENALWKEGVSATERIASGKAQTPYQRRILIPKLAAAISSGTGATLPSVELGIRTVSLAGVLIVAELLLAELMGSEVSLAGALVLAALLPLGFYFNPYVESYPSLLFLGLALLFLLRKQYPLILLCVGVGVFIRESALLTLLVLAVCCLLPGIESSRRPLAITLAAGALLYFAGALFLHARYPGPSYEGSLLLNLQNLRASGMVGAATQVLTLFAPVGIALGGWRRAEGVSRAMLIVGVVYALGLPLVAHVNEPRAWWEAYLLVLPALMAAVSTSPQSLPVGRTETAAAS